MVPHENRKENERVSEQLKPKNLYLFKCKPFQERHSSIREFALDECLFAYIYRTLHLSKRTGTKPCFSIAKITFMNHLHARTTMQQFVSLRKCSENTISLFSILLLENVLPSRPYSYVLIKCFPKGKWDNILSQIELLSSLRIV